MQLNPYQMPATSEQTVAVAVDDGVIATRQALLVGGCVGAFTAMVISGLLIFVMLIPEIRVLWLAFIRPQILGLVMLVSAAGAGGAAGALLGHRYPRPRCRSIAAMIVCLPVLVLHPRLFQPLEPPGVADVAAGIVLLATVGGVLVAYRTLNAIVKRRGTDGSEDGGRYGRWKTVETTMTTVLAATSISVDMWLWEEINRHGLGGSASVLGIALVLVAGAVAMSSYLAAAYPDLKKQAIWTGGFTAVAFLITATISQLAQ